MFLYKYVLQNEVIYVGKTKRDINQRIREHYITKDLPDDADILIYKCDSEAYMNVMEIVLIDKYRPKYNKDCHPLEYEKLSITGLLEPSFIPLNQYNEQVIAYEYKRNIKGTIVALMSDGSERRPEYCQCIRPEPEKTFNPEGCVYDVCKKCKKLIKNSFEDII